MPCGNWVKSMSMVPESLAFRLFTTLPSRDTTSTLEPAVSPESFEPKLLEKLTWLIPVSLSDGKNLNDFTLAASTETDSPLSFWQTNRFYLYWMVGLSAMKNS